MIRKFSAWAAERAISIGAIICALIALSFPIRAQLNAPQTWAGVASGTSSAIQITIHNVNSLGDILSVPLRFTPSGINTGAATLQVNIDGGSNLGTIPILKQTQTSGGLTALTGNEFQPSQIISVMYDGTQFQCLTCYPVEAPGTVKDFSGINIPAGWVLANGTSLSRSSFSVLWNVLAFPSVAATTINGNNTITVASTANYQQGWFVGGSNVFCNAQITSIPDGVHLVLDHNATNGGSSNISIGPYQQGDCATTFNIPNFVGHLSAGVDGTNSITSAACVPQASSATAATLGASCGAQTQTLTPLQIPTINSNLSVSVAPTGGKNVPGTSGLITSVTPGNGGASLAGYPATNAGGSGDWANVGFNGTGTGVSSNTGGLAHPILPPLTLIYKIIKT